MPQFLNYGGGTGCATRGHFTLKPKVPCPRRSASENYKRRKQQGWWLRG